MTNKVIRNESKLGVCLSEKSRFMKENPEKKVVIIKQAVIIKKSS